jgi:hypothetical protein
MRDASSSKSASLPTSTGLVVVETRGRVVKKVAALCALAGAVMSFAGAAAAQPVVGAAEDGTKYSSDGGSSIYARMRSYGLTSNRISVFWNFNEPATIQEKEFLDRVVPAAHDAGVQLVFAIYADPRVKGGVTAIGQNPDAFCAYAAQIAQTYPSVTKIIVGNEPNQKRFWQPQPHSGTAFEPVMATCYDALKAVNPDIDVIGVGLSPRGNDQPTEVNNASSSPVRFIRDLAAAYRASGRTKPLFDEFAFHCYPNVNTDPVTRGYEWPNIGCVNLGRLKQALWDGFHGTAQPTPLEGFSVQGLDATKPLTIVVDETGWQVAVTGFGGYTGSENVPTINDSVQALDYAQLVRIALCDPAVTAFHFLYLLDNANLADFQSGMERVDASARQSSTAVHDAIAAGCTGRPTNWKHATKVIGAKASTGFSPSGKRAIVVNSKEDFAYTLVATVRGKKATVKGIGKANSELDAEVPPGFKGATVTVTLSAWANRDRKTTFTLKL